jgi:vancomycin resistance protein YoaR
MTDPRPPREDNRRARRRNEGSSSRSRSARTPLGRRAKVVVISVAVVALVGIILLIAGGGGGGGVAPQVVVAGVDMGQDEAQVTTALTARGKALTQRLVNLDVDGGVLGVMRPSDLGATVNVAAAKTMAADEAPGRLTRGFRAVTGAGPIISPLPVTYRKGAVDAWVADIAAQVDRPEKNARVQVQGVQFTVTPQADGRALDRSRLKQMVSGDLSSLPSHLQLPVYTTRPTLTTDAARAQVRQAQQVLERGTQVSVDGLQTTLDRAGVAAAFHFGPQGLSLSGADLRKTLIAAYPATSVIPAPARFEVRGTQVVVVPSKDGRLVDGKQVANGLMGEGRPAQSTYVNDNPVFTTEKAQSLGIKEEVGSFTTPYSPGEPRVTNIRRASQILNGTIIPPNGRLSLNETLGERTVERGFVAAPMLADGLHVDSIGGGVSQVATTLFNAAFFAGFELNQHTAHQLYIDRYPLAREATISWPNPDLVITNDWDASALVRVSNSTDSITVTIYSTSFDRRVEESTSNPYSFTKPKTRYVATEGVPVGQKKEITSGDRGYTVDITRKVFKGSELLSDDTFFTVYLAPPKVIGVAPGTPGAETPSAPSG